MMQEINILEELFLSTEIWSYFGPIAVVVAGIFFVKKDKVLFFFFLLLDSLLAYHYWNLVSADGWYIWHAWIMTFGIIVTLGYALSK